MRSFSRAPAPRLALAVLALVTAACSGGGDQGAGRAGRRGGATTTTAVPVPAFALVGADVRAMAAQAPPFPEDVKAAAKAGLDAWLSAGVVAPLRSGSPPAGLEAAFTPAALARVSVPGPDRAAMVEEGGPLSGRVTQERADAHLTVLTAPGGQAAVVTAVVEVVHTVRPARRGAAAVVVARSGEVVLVPDAGAWRIDAYDVRTARDSRPAAR